MYLSSIEIVEVIVIGFYLFIGVFFCVASILISWKRCKHD